MEVHTLTKHDGDVTPRLTGGFLFRAIDLALYSTIGWYITCSHHFQSIRRQLASPFRMSTTSSNTFVLFGSGPGIGLHVAARFAQNQFQHVILLSRDRERLEKDAVEVRAARPGVKVTVVACDLSKLVSVREALATIDKVLQDDGTTLEVVCFNAARVRPTNVLATAPEEYEMDFRASNTPSTTPVCMVC